MNNEIEIVKPEAFSSAEIKLSALMLAMPFVIPPAYKRISKALKQAKIAEAGAYYARYIGMDPVEQCNKSFLKMIFQRLEFYCGITVAKKLPQLAGNINYHQQPVSTYARTMHIGPYRGLGQTYKKFVPWFKEHQDYRFGGEVLEKYLNDPKTTAKAELETEIFVKLQPN